MKILLIDGNSLLYRSYYGSAYSPAGILKNSQGVPVNAVLTFNNMINRIINTYKPDHLLVAFDAGKKTKRHEKLESYKAGRQATPSELITQFPIAKEMLDHMGIKRLELPGIEADDIIATIANRLKDTEAEVMICSSDRDLFQMVSSNITVIVPQNGTKEDLIMTPNNFVEVYGCEPYQVPDLKGIMGDASDNLVGVKGIGEKGAIKLVQEYKTIEGIYEAIDSISGATKIKLIESKEMAFLCKELATLDKNVEIAFKNEELEFKNEITNELIDFFKKYELNSLVKKYSQDVKTTILGNIIF